MYIRSQISTKINSKMIHINSIDSPISDDYQFYLIQKGAIAYSSRDENLTLQKDDVIVIAPNTQFSLRPLTANTLLSVRIDELSISRIIPQDGKLICNSALFPAKDYREIRRILVDFCSAFYAVDNEKLIISLIYQLSECLCKNYIQVPSSEINSKVEAANVKRISQIVSYIQVNYNQAISLTTLAEELFITPRYLSTFIKKNLGTTFLKYLTQVRLKNAVVELTETASSVADIAYDNGFPNVAAFNKSFKDLFHCSPYEYKRKAQEARKNHPPDPESSVTESDLSTSLNNQTQIQINTKQIAPYYKSWNDTINLGTLSNLLTASFYDSFKRYHKTVAVKYVRFTDAFSTKTITKEEEHGDYNFSKLDTFIDFLVKLNIIPFFKLEKNCLTATTEASVDSHLRSFDCEILTAFLRHCIYRYSYKFVSSWRFEITLGHDKHLSLTDTPSEYMKFYTKTCQLIKQTVPECTVGGPGYNTCGDFEQFKTHLEYYAKHHASFDFISYYAYSYELSPSGAASSFDVAAIISPDPDHIYYTFCKYQELIELNYPQTPVFITELGATIFGSNYIYDSVYLSAFLCRNYLKLFQHCSCVAFNSFTAPPSNTDHPASTYHPEAGMISNNGIPNPVLHAYNFLTSLGRNLIACGENYIMTCNSSNRYQLLIFHYVHFNKQFCMNSLDTLPLDHTYSIFEESAHQILHFECADISPGRYKVTQFALNRNYGSALDKYIRILKQGNTTLPELLSTILHFTEKEATYYRQTSIPRQDIHYTDFDNTLRMDIALTPHEVQFFEFLRVH